MKTLIVPCSGRSSRFKNMRPKYLLTYPDGEIMVKKAISGLNLNYFDRIIITIVREHCEKYESEIILKQAFRGTEVEICVLPEFTSCQSETVYETIKKMNVKGSIVIKDSDNYLEADLQYSDNFVVGLNINTFGREVFRLESKSFLIVNDQDFIVDIIEKRIKSDVICVGMYGFADAEEFCRNYETVCKEFDFAQSKEIYLSHIISFMIGADRTLFKCIYANSFEDWGTPRDWNIVRDSMKTYFIDLDGVVFENRGKYGSKNWSNDNTPIDENIEIIKELYNNGAQIVITTSRDESFKDFINKFFMEHDIKLHAVVTGCNHAARVLINDFAPSNPYPSCIAVSLPRNEKLKNYFN